MGRCAAAAMVVPWALLGEELAALVIAPLLYAAVLTVVEYRFHPGDVSMVRDAFRRRAGADRLVTDLDAA